MIGSGPRRPPGLARWAESYEVKCERRQEMRESRRLRPNVTTCRQVGRAWRTQQREQLQRARQLQFFRKRNLEAEKGQAQPLRASEQGHCRSAGQAAVFKELLSDPKRNASPGQQVTGTSPTAFPTQSRPPSSVHRDLADHCGALPPRDSPTRRPPKHHRGTQTKAEDTQPAIKNDASQQTNCGVAVLDKEIIQLSEYLKEALQRELVLKQKMVILQDLLSTLIQASDRSWKGQLNEDKLKGRLRSLENQLYACTQVSNLSARESENSGPSVLLLEMFSYLGLGWALSLCYFVCHVTASSLPFSCQDVPFACWEGIHQLQGNLENTPPSGETLGRFSPPSQHPQFPVGVLVFVLCLETGFPYIPQLALNLGQSSCLSPLDNTGMRHNSWRVPVFEQMHWILSGIIFVYLLMGISLKIKALSKGVKRFSARNPLAHTSFLCFPTGMLQNQSLQLQEQEKLLQKDQALPMWTTKPSLEVEPESTGKDKDWDLRDQLQKKTLQLQAKEQECTELHSELDSLSDEYLSCLQKLQDCREELNHSQQLPPTRQCGRWLPILMVVIAAALAVFLANKDSLTI
ncbi:TRAF3-interacting JNK-activating modulator [Fukomys damarensis]|uniref:TRAF3-interacting JNK-activating modulator n=1 Tax=Fukomys damarensis TaxID=885580 RepID=UPI0014556883|nr:TRAF3-interacting JNK-activating modulator [Fukomys damarensis]